MPVYSDKYIFEIEANVQQGIDKVQQWLTLMEQVSQQAPQLQRIVGVSDQDIQSIRQAINTQEQLNQTYVNGALRRLEWEDKVMVQVKKGDEVVQELGEGWRRVTQDIDEHGRVAREVETIYRNIEGAITPVVTKITDLRQQLLWQDIMSQTQPGLGWATLEEAAAGGRAAAAAAPPSYAYRAGISDADIRAIERVLDVQTQLTNVTRNGVPVMRQWIDLSSQNANVWRRVSQVMDESGAVINQTTTYYRRLADGTIQTAQRIEELESSSQKASGGFNLMNNRFLRHLVIISEAIVTYEAFRRVGEVINEIIEVHRELSRQVALFKVSVDDSADSVSRYLDALDRISYMTGVGRAGVGEAITLARRIGQPIDLAMRAAEMELFTGPEGISAEQAVRELYSLMVQFPQMQTQQILDVFARGVRAGTLDPADLVQMSETWGAFSRQFSMDMQGIVSLFTGLSTVLGETGSSVEMFMRHLERFYTNEQLRALTERFTGISPVVYTREGEEIRRPLIEILRAVAQLPEEEQRQIAEYMPQELGQRSRQFFNQLIFSFDQLEQTIRRVNDASITWRDTIAEMATTSDATFSRLEVSWKNLLATLENTAPIQKAAGQLAALFDYMSLMMREPPAETRSMFEQGFLRDIGTGADVLNLLRQELGSRIAREVAVEPMGIGDIIRTMSGVPSPPGIDLTWLRIPEAVPPGREEQAIRNALREMMIDPMYMALMRRQQEGAVGYAEIAQFIRNWLTSPQGLEAMTRWPMLEAPRVGADPWIRRWQQGELRPYAREVVEEEGYLSGEYFGARRVAISRELAKAYGDQNTTMQEFLRVYDELKQGIIDSAEAAGYRAKVEEETVLITDAYGRVIGEAAVNTDIASAALRLLADNAEDAADNLLEIARVGLARGVSLDQFMTSYEQVRQMLEAQAAASGIPLVEEPKPVMIYGPGGVPLGVRELDPRVASMTSTYISEQQRQNQENQRYQRQIMQYWERLLNALPGLGQPTPVTGVEYYVETPAGTYQDKIDESIRQMWADIEHIIKGEPTEYGLGVTLFPDIFTPEVMGAARAAEIPVKRSILTSAGREAQRQFYGFMRPLEEYDLEAIAREAERYFDEQEQARSNRQAIIGFLEERFGPRAKEFFQAQFGAPIVSMLTGGQTSEEISTQIADAIDMPQAIGKGMEQVQWGIVIQRSVASNIEAQRGVWIATGQMMGQPLAEGAASQFVALIVPQILAQLAKQMRNLPVGP